MASLSSDAVMEVFFIYLIAVIHFLLSFASSVRPIGSYIERLSIDPEKRKRRRRRISFYGVDLRLLLDP